ncbi:MAG TPA: acyl-CoA reductase [Burkholderiaceae bacterium]
MNADYQELVANSPQPEQLAATPSLLPFSDAALKFVDDLSQKIMRAPQSRAFPELVSLAYWMRKANLERLRTDMQQRMGNTLHVPRGTVLHIAPSNVDTIFVYSWFLSLLTGNKNIVRLSSKVSMQADFLVNAIAELLSMPAHADIAQRTLLVRYAPDDRVTERFSSVCDVRVIWGGDSTVQQIRKLPLPPTSIEVAFANKYSLAVLDVKRWQAQTDEQKNTLANAFYNDAYWFDQMACSSPRLVLWVGDMESSQQAANDFWPRVQALISKRRERFADRDYVNKLFAQDSMAIESDVSIPMSGTNDLARVWLKEPALHQEHHCGAGLFFESAILNLDAIRPLLNRTVQTLSYAGFTQDEFRAFIQAAPIAGIDRIVPFGQALNFGAVWDGFDLARVFMREVSLL